MSEQKELQVKTLTSFEVSKEELTELCKIYDKLIVNEETFEEAKKARASLRARRWDIQRVAKINTDALNDLKNQNWDNERSMIGLIEPTESRLDNGIKEIEYRKAAIKAEKDRIEREKVEAEIKAEQERLAKVERDRIAAVEAAQRAEAERLAALQAEIEDRNRIEQQRLNKIKADQEAKEVAIQAEQKRILAEQQEREAKIKADQEEIDRQKRAIEEAKQLEEREKIRLAELEKAKKEAAELAVIEAEKKARFDAEQKQAAELKVKEAARIKALNAPDKEKLISFALILRGLEYPTLSTDDSKFILQETVILLKKVTDYIESNANKL